MEQLIAPSEGDASPVSVSKLVKLPRAVFSSEKQVQDILNDIIWRGILSIE